MSDIEDQGSFRAPASMMERTAEAIFDSTDCHWSGAVSAARAALESLREIDRKQLAPICVDRDDFVAVIDAILDEA